MGLLTTQQIDNLQRNRVKQQLLLVLNSNWESTGVTFDSLLADDSNVIDWGRRDSTLYNVSLQSPGELSVQSWTVEIGATPEWVAATNPGNLKGAGIQHKVYVFGDSGIATELPCSGWTGRVVDVTVNDVIAPDGSISLATVSLTMEGVLARTLRSVWTRDHGDDVTDPYVASPSGIQIGSVISGWDKPAANIRLWVQMTVTPSCSATGTFMLPGYASGGTDTDTGTTIQVSHTTVLTSMPPYAEISPRVVLDTGTVKRVVKVPEIPIIKGTDSSSTRPW